MSNLKHLLGPGCYWFLRLWLDVFLLGDGVGKGYGPPCKSSASERQRSPSPLKLRGKPARAGSRAPVDTPAIGTPQVSAKRGRSD